MAKRTERTENLATEIISIAKRKLRRCRVALIISLAGNVVYQVTKLREWRRLICLLPYYTLQKGGAYYGN